MKEKTKRQLEEVYCRNLYISGAFSKTESPELFAMCKNCTEYKGEAHDYTLCRQKQCFINWLAFEYLEWVNGY